MTLKVRMSQSLVLVCHEELTYLHTGRPFPLTVIWSEIHAKMPARQGCLATTGGSCLKFEMV